jgi:hypothetical protein
MASEQQLMDALRRADAAGDTEAARAIAQRIKSMRGQPAQTGQGLGVMAAENPFVALSNKVSAGQQLTPKEQSQFTATRNMLLKREKAGDPVAIDILAAARQGRAATMGNKDYRGTGFGGFLESIGNMAPIERQMAGLGSTLQEQMLGVGQGLGLVDRKQVDIAKVGAAPLQQTAGGAFGKLVGDILPFAAAAKVIQAPAKAGALVRNVLTPAVQAGGTAALLQPVGTGESKAGQVGTAAAFGTGGQLAGAGLGKVYGGRSAAIEADPVLRNQLQAAERSGITLLPRDVLDSPVYNKIDSLLSNIPFTGASGAAARRQAEINLAAGKPIGITTPYIRPGFSPAGGRLELEQAQRSAGKAFNNFWQQKNIGVDVNDLVALNNVKAGIVRDSGGSTFGKAVVNQVDEILTSASKGPLSGNKYTSARRRLLTLAGKPDTAEYARTALDALESIASKNLTPTQLKELRRLNAKYADVKRVEQAVSVSGDVNPSAIGRNVQKKGEAASPEMRALATATPVLTNPVPVGIGTAEKLLSAGAVLGTGYLANPYLGAALYGAGRASKSPTVAQYLMKGAPGVAAKAPLVGPRLAQAMPAPATVSGATKTGGAVVGGALSAKDSKAEMERRRKELIRRQSLLNK